MRPIGETLWSAWVRRHLRRKQIVKLRIGGVCVDHGIDQCAYESVERRGRILNERGFDHAVDLLYMALMKRGEDGSLVWKILIDRSDARARNLCDAVGRYSASSLSLQDAEDCFEDSVNGLACTELLGLTSMRRGESSGHRRLDYYKCELSYIFCFSPDDLSTTYIIVRSEYTSV